MGIPDLNQGTKFTDTQFKDAESFTAIGWDFAGETANGTDDIWYIDPTETINNGFPYLVGVTPAE